MVKRLINFFLITTLCLTVSAKELNGKNLSYVHKALDAKLIQNCFEKAEDKLSYLSAELSETENADINDEAKLIASTLLKIEMESVKTSEEMRILKENEKGKKNKKKINQEDLNPGAKDVIFDCFEKYKAFDEANKDLSSYFYFHFNETMYATIPYLSKKEQLKIMTSMPDDYKRLEEINPDMAETLNMYGAVLYFMPGAFGGSKKLAEEKIRKAIEVSACDYEKANALVLYAQFLFEEKEKDEAAKLMDQALALSPENLSIKKMRDANLAGYSIFKMNEYEKTLE